MNLVQCLRKHLNSRVGVLPQQRSLERTTALGVGILCGVGKRTITQAIGFHGNTHKDWSAVNHRDEKEVLGVGEAQVWNEKSVCKVPALLVAMYSWLILAGLECYGPTRTDDYLPLPKWRQGAKRPSCLDLVNLLRKQLAQTCTFFATGTSPPCCQTMVEAAAA